jgi:cyclomaltodextrinase / maltogenic alpha-amylase / neopullulanase
MDSRFLRRKQDWRVGKIVYQVFVDRFAPPLDLASKRNRYQPWQALQPWHALPLPGKKSTNLPHYDHELTFWGGDLKSLLEKIDYFKNLGVQTLYLNPIFEARTNHKYDTVDYRKISPEYGDEKDLIDLIHAIHQRGMKIILDGVFNHVASCHPFFVDARNHEHSMYRDWFFWGNTYRHGYRAWHHVPSLPELNLNHPQVRAYLLKEVVQYYLKLGIDGWRLDTAIELGKSFLTALTEASHAVNPEALIIGEILQYPQPWFPAVDAVKQLGLRSWIIHTLQQDITANVAQNQLNQYVQEIGIENMLKSWTLLENHDVPRSVYQFPSKEDYILAKILQWTLPGNVQLYQGEELGFSGGHDPQNREPMIWQLNPQHQQSLQYHQQLIQIRNDYPALAIGDYVPLITEQLVAFARKTDQVQETCIIVVNPNPKEIKEVIMLPFGDLPYDAPLVDVLTKQVKTKNTGMYITLTLPAKSAVILVPDLTPKEGYLPNKYDL